MKQIANVFLFSSSFSNVTCYFISRYILRESKESAKATSIKSKSKKSFKQKLPIFEKSLIDMITLLFTWEFVFFSSFCCFLFFLFLCVYFAHFLYLSIQFRKSSRASLTFYSVCWNLYDLIFEPYILCKNKTNIKIRT